MRVLATLVLALSTALTISLINDYRSADAKAEPLERQLVVTSSRALLFKESGGPRCIVQFNAGGQFVLPPRCKARMPLFALPTTWRQEKSEIFLQGLGGEVSMTFRADGNKWRGIDTATNTTWILVFMTLEVEPH